MSYVPVSGPSMTIQVPNIHAPRNLALCGSQALYSIYDIPVSKCAPT